MRILVTKRGLSAGCGEETLMLAKTTLLVASLLAVTGCKLELPSIGGSNISGPLSVETVEFQQAGAAMP